MEKTNELLSKLSLNNQLTLDDIPTIDLYMDQVIQLFEKSFSENRRNEDEKVLTKTMINNYAKGKLFFPIKNKKYSKEHLILISLIYHLKGALSIQDIKVTLENLNEKIVEDDVPLSELYQGFLNLTNKNAEHFKNDVIEKSLEVRNETDAMNLGDSEYLEKMLTIASFVNMSNMYKRAAEMLVDELEQEQKQKRQTPKPKV